MSSKNTPSKHINSQDNSLQGACTSWFFNCVGITVDESSNHQSVSGRETRGHFPTLSGMSVDSTNSWDEGAMTSDEELLEDLELVLEGRGLVSTIFLPSKNPNDPSPIPRTAFLRSKHCDPKIECQVVVDNSIVANGSLKRFTFSVFDVVDVSKGRNKGCVIPAHVADDLIMRFTIVKKGELHFVFESQHVRDDIVHGFKLLIAKKIATIKNDAAERKSVSNGRGDDEKSEKSSRSAFGFTPTTTPAKKPSSSKG